MAQRHSRRFDETQHPLARGATPPEESDEALSARVGRREFLKRAVATGVALGSASLWGAACAPAQEAPPAAKAPGAATGAAPKPAGALKTVKIAEAAHTTQYGAMYFANRMGFFREQGIELDITTTGNRVIAIQSVIAGEAHFSCHDPAEGGLARTKGADIKMPIPLVMRNLSFVLVPKSSTAKGFADLKGLRLTTHKEPSTGYSNVLELLGRYNFEMVERNIWRPKGSTSKADQLEIIEVDVGSELPTLVAGRADAGHVYMPAEAIGEVEANLRILISIMKEIGPFFYTSFNGLGKTIAADPDLVQRFVNGMTKSFKWAHKNPGDAIRVMKEEFPKVNPVAIEQSVGRMIADGGWPDSPVITKQAFDANFNDLLVKTKHPAAGAKYEDLVMTEFAEKANATITV
ncbi:MAG: ABC transporter substrate-binding protein [Chloroflexi bacterium]|nr:ABC transporter substrate-binding protein [Chloroflexota bacterium]